MGVKLVYVLWRRHDLPVPEFRTLLLEKAGPQLVTCGADGLVINVADTDATFGVPAPHPSRPLAGVVSVRLRDREQRAETEAVLSSVSAGLAGYLVDEHVARDRGPRRWKLAERSPGAKLVTLFARAANLTRDDFMRHWSEVHTPIALRVHPQWSFVRNIVLAAYGDGAPAYDGIVEEHCRELRDITDPKRYFGNPKNIKVVVDSARRFLDLTKVESHIMSEYVLRD